MIPILKEVELVGQRGSEGEERVLERVRDWKREGEWVREWKREGSLLKGRICRLQNKVGFAHKKREKFINYNPQYWVKAYG